MVNISYPAKKPEIKTEAGREYIFCSSRRRWFVLTPEEWVRQNFLNYLALVLQYPMSLIAVEKQLMLNGRRKRFDIVVYKNSLPFMIVECKEMNVMLTEDTMLQALRYNTDLQAEIMVITNGTNCAAFRRNANGFVAVAELPAYN